MTRLGCRVVRRVQCGQPQLGVLDGEAVQVDPLLVHEPDPADRPAPGGALIATPPGRAARRPGPGRARRGRCRPGTFGADHDPGAVGPEQVAGELDRLAVDVGGRPGDGHQRCTRLDVQDGRLVRRGQDHLDPLDRVVRPGAEVLLDQLVDRPAQRQLEQAGEALGREFGPFQRDWAAVREPDPDQVHDQVAGPDAQRLGGGVVGRGQPGGQHPRPGHHALAAQQRGYPDDAGQVPLDLALGHEGPAAPAGHPADQAAFLQDGERLAERGPADPELGGQGALGAEPLAGPQLPAADLLGQDPPDLVRSPAGGDGDRAHQRALAASTASEVSGST